MVCHPGDEKECDGPNDDCGDNETCLHVLFVLVRWEFFHSNLRRAHIQFSNPFLVLFGVVAGDFEALWAARLPVI